MYNFVLVFHVIVVISLIGIILVQRGRSGGLVEALGGVESIFGTKTSAFLVKITVFLSICFFATSISLAYLSKQKGKSLLDNYQDIPVAQKKVSQDNQAKDADKESLVVTESQDNQAKDADKESLVVTESQDNQVKDADKESLAVTEPQDNDTNSEVEEKQIEIEPQEKSLPPTDARN